MANGLTPGSKFNMKFQSALFINYLLEKEKERKPSIFDRKSRMASPFSSPPFSELQEMCEKDDDFLLLITLIQDLEQQPAGVSPPTVLHEPNKFENL